MQRRSFLLGLSALTLSRAAWSGETPWTARILKGGFDGRVWWAGLHVSLDEGWKTYWRVPGEGGVAPQFDLPGENIAKAEIFHPLPHRFEDEAGMTIGYKNEVVFPVSLAPRDVTRPMTVLLKSFFGVCDVVCIPAQFAGELQFDPTKSDAPDQAQISRWQRLVPVPSTEGPIIKATAQMVDGKPIIDCDVREAVTDMFAEGNPAHYFGKPSFMRGIALLPVSGARSVDELRGADLRVTLDVRGRGLEQRVTVV